MTGPGRERSILFQSAMVRAILAGKKTQTRRIVKLPPLQPWQQNSKGWHFIESNHSIDDCNYYIAGFGDGLGTIINIKCPYGKPAFAPFDLPADRLWVREKYMKARCPIAMSNAEQVARGPAIDENWQHCAWYEDSRDPLGWPIREGWKSPIFMPRWASRITLEITAWSGCRISAKRTHGQRGSPLSAHIAISGKKSMAPDLGTPTRMSGWLNFAK